MPKQRISCNVEETDRDDLTTQQLCSALAVTIEINSRQLWPSKVTA